MSQNSRNRCFSYYFCLMIEGSGSISLTNGSDFGSGSATLKGPNPEQVPYLLDPTWAKSSGSYRFTYSIPLVVWNRYSEGTVHNKIACLGNLTGSKSPTGVPANLSLTRVPISSPASSLAGEAVRTTSSHHSVQGKLIHAGTSCNCCGGSGSLIYID
jgi:hypothetical protein